MVQAVINIDENTNRVLNIVKAKFGLKDKSQAINLVVNDYEKNSLEPELRPEYIKKIKNIEEKGKFTNYSNLSQLRKEIQNA
jgi:hypothetical protein